jgi:tetratricopeptide (TPR) repeat protein
MSDESKDFYRSRDRERPVLEERAQTEADERWLRATQARWKNALLVAMLVLLVGILMGVIYYQTTVIRGEQGQGAGTVGAIVLAPQGTYNAPVDIDPEGRLVLDELADVAPDAVPTGGVAALTPHWIKQAAIHLRQGERAYEEGNWSSALRSFEEVRRILPDIERLNEWIGLCQLRLKNYEKAGEVFALLSTRRPKSAPLLNNLGVAHLGQDRRDEASADFRKAIALDPEYVPAHQNLGLLHYRTGAMEAAMKSLKKVVRSDPMNSEAALIYAVALLKLGRWAESAAILEEATRTSPSAPVYFRLAEARARMGTPEVAMKALQRGLDLVDGRRALVWLNRSEFDPLRKYPDFQKLVADLSQAIR